uniref:Transposase n=1 Tax=Nothobranchius furzeri TaxID=105023 RepID=A0A1A8ALZ5_NOTFU
MKKNLKAAMNVVEYIATTADCWTAHRRSFTAHWIEPGTMERCSAALACKQLKGPHTFSALAGALNDIHTEYKIHDEIVRTTSDNGSNFINAFPVYGELDAKNGEPFEGARPNETAEKENSEDEGDNVDLEFVESWSHVG